jgi:hypothetical protein
MPNNYFIEYQRCKDSVIITYKSLIDIDNTYFLDIGKTDIENKYNMTIDEFIKVIKYCILSYYKNNDCIIYELKWSKVNIKFTDLSNTILNITLYKHGKSDWNMDWKFDDFIYCLSYFPKKIDYLNY